MAREVEREPALLEEPRLEAVGVRRRDHEDAAWLQQLGGTTERLGGMRQVFERVPEDDGGEIAPVEVRDVGRLDVGAGRDELEAERVASLPAQRVEQRAVPGADVQHGAGRRDLVEPSGERAARALEEGVAGTGEAPAGGPVPPLVGTLERRLRGPRVGRGGAAALAAHHSARARGTLRQLGVAPRAVRGGRVRGRG